MPFKYIHMNVQKILEKVLSWFNQIKWRKKKDATFIDGGKYTSPILVLFKEYGHNEPLKDYADDLSS